jgi:TRAP-type C4-dicarboxylate transport system permease small subunit
LSRILAWLETFEQASSRVLLSITVVLVVVASLARWIGYPIVWSVDIAQLLFVWVCFLGANQALRRGEHIGVDALVNRLPAGARRWIWILHLILMAVFLVPIVWYGIDLTVLNIERRFSDTDLSYAWVTVAVPIGSALLFITVLRLWLSAVLKQRDGRSLEETRP